MHHYIAPNGIRIIGTWETIPGTAYVDGWELDDDGRLQPDYSGETDLRWDFHAIVCIGKDRQLVDDEGGVWLESQCRLIEGSSSPDAPWSSDS